MQRARCPLSSPIKRNVAHLRNGPKVNVSDHQGVKAKPGCRRISKETQLTNMRVCDTADVRVDTFPGRVFRRKVEQLSPASGSQFALLPPDNATGNFTWLRNNGADQGLPNCCYRRNHARVSSTSIFPRVALEYGHTWWAWCTNSSAMALSMPGR